GRCHRARACRRAHPACAGRDGGRHRAAATAGVSAGPVLLAAVSRVSGPLLQPDGAARLALRPEAAALSHPQAQEWTSVVTAWLADQGRPSRQAERTVRVGVSARLSVGAPRSGRGWHRLRTDLVDRGGGYYRAAAA